MKRSLLTVLAVLVLALALPLGGCGSEPKKEDAKGAAIEERSEPQNDIAESSTQNKLVITSWEDFKAIKAAAAAENRPLTKEEQAAVEKYRRGE
jgi:hypothetical protein